MRTGEINRLVTFLSPTDGLMRAIAYGAAKPTSRMRLATMLFAHVELRLYRDPVKDQFKLTELDCHNDFGGIRASVSRFYAASVWAELLVRSPGAADAQALFQLLLGCLRLIDDADTPYQRAISTQFLWRYLALCGLQPSLAGCSACGSTFGASAEAFVSASEADLRCDACCAMADTPLHAGARRYLAQSERLPLAEAVSVRLQHEQELRHVLYGLVQQAIGAPLATLRVASGTL